MKVSKMKLAIAMSKKGFNFKALADVATISRATLSSINNGKTCRPEILFRLAKALDVEPEYLLEEA